MSKGKLQSGDELCPVTLRQEKKESKRRKVLYISKHLNLTV